MSQLQAVTPGASAPLHRPFKLGFLSHVHGAGDPRRVYQELLELFIAADELGFDGGWIAQHHFQQEFGRLPSPLVFLAAVAERTRHIELATGVVVLPFEDPIRLAEDAAVLDALSGGRVQLGLGSGGANLTGFAAFGLDAEQRQQDFAAAVQVLGKTLRQEPLAATTTTLQPPAPGLSQRLWHSHSSPEGAAFAAQQGNGLLLGTAVHDPEKVQRPLAETYLNAWTDTHSKPRIGIVRAVFPAADKAAALAEIGDDVLRHAAWLERIGHANAAQLSAADIVGLLNVHHGSAAEIVDSLRADPALLPYADYFIPVVQSESSTLDQAIRRLEIIAREIAPALGWSPARKIVQAA